MSNFDDVWATLLSGDDSLIRRTWADLTDAEAGEISEHLRKIVDEEGYSEEQKEAARTALAAIRRAV